MMSPREYYAECASNIFKNTSVISLKAQRSANAELIAQYQQDMQEGDKFPLCYLNYANPGQEGLHRMMAAGNVFGWDAKFPVLVVDAVDSRKEELNKLWRYWCDATYNAKEMKYSPDNWEEEIVEEIEYNLEHSTGEHYDVVITDRPTQEHLDMGCEYAIEVALKEFEDIMSPTTLYTPEFKNPEEKGYNWKGIDDLDDIDWDILLDDM